MTTTIEKAVRTRYHVVWGSDELHSGILHLWSFVRFTVRPGDRVVHELIWNWTRKEEEEEEEWVKHIIQWIKWIRKRTWTLTVIDPVTEVTLPPALVQEGDEGVDVGATGAAAHDRVRCDDGELLQTRKQNKVESQSDVFPLHSTFHSHITPTCFYEPTELTSGAGLEQPGTEPPIFWFKRDLFQTFLCSRLKRSFCFWCFSDRTTVTFTLYILLYYLTYYVFIIDQTVCCWTAETHFEYSLSWPQADIC